MNYEPDPKPTPFLKPGEFPFAAVHLDHSHINGQTRNLIDAGATLKWVYDPNPAKLKAFQERFPEARAAESLDQVLEDEEVRLVTAAAIPCQRGPIGVRVLQAGKDYYTDKSPFTTLEQLEEARAAAKETGRKYMVNYGERLGNEAGMFAGQLIERGAIGAVVAVHGFGPHRVGDPSNRPEWFFQKEKYGGILTDIGSHQCEQFLYYAGASDAGVCHARVDNVAHPQFPELEDYGEANLLSDNGVSFYFRVDWLTPKGLSAWGDGRTFIIGTEGFIELRKFVDLTLPGKKNQLYIVNDDGEQVIDCTGKVGAPFYYQLLRDCVERTETAMTQEHAFKAAELSMRCQQVADRERALLHNP